MIRVFHLAAISLLLTALVPSALRGEAPEADGSGSDNVSYHRDIRPIFQAYCHGCHQPAKQSGGYEMTEYERLVKGGESGQPAIVPGQPDASNLVTQIVPADGQAEMPKDKPPLDGTQIDLITKWINQGAANDAPDSPYGPQERSHQNEPAPAPVPADFEASVPAAAPVPGQDPDRSGAGRLAPNEAGDIAVALSGGGVRAAALSTGVLCFLKELGVATRIKVRAAR